MRLAYTLLKVEDLSKPLLEAAYAMLRIKPKLLPEVRLEPFIKSIVSVPGSSPDIFLQVAVLAKTKMDCNMMMNRWLEGEVPERFVHEHMKH